MSERTIRLGRRLPDEFGEPVSTGPDWAQASPARIRSALSHALSLPSGGWYAVDATHHLRTGPRRYEVAGRPLVAWRDGSRIAMGYDECPHMGASLSAGRVCDGQVVCPWHGLALGAGKHGAWQPLKVHDDGLLFWVRLDCLHEAAALSDAPFIAPRPRHALSGVIRLEARCEPSDVLANRLDPWHGGHFHPYAFTNLRVTEASDACLRLRVSYRVLGPLVVEVDATFHSPDPRTIVMTIVDGEGQGSVVETHATPISEGRTAILEATLATSERLGFRVVRGFSRALRPFVERAARALWLDDRIYAERTYALRTGAVATSIPIDVPSDLRGLSGAAPSGLVRKRPAAKERTS